MAMIERTTIIPAPAANMTTRISRRVSGVARVAHAGAHPEMTHTPFAPCLRRLLSAKWARLTYTQPPERTCAVGAAAWVLSATTAPTQSTLAPVTRNMVSDVWDLPQQHRLRCFDRPAPLPAISLRMRH